MLLGAYFFREEDCSAAGFVFIGMGGPSRDTPFEFKKGEKLGVD